MHRIPVLRLHAAAVRRHRLRLDVGRRLALLWRLCQREAQHLADDDDNGLHDDLHGEHEPRRRAHVRKDEQLAVHEAHQHKRQARDDGEYDAVLALRDVALVEQRQQRLQAQQRKHANHEAAADLARLGVADVRRAARADGKRGAEAADEEQDHGDEHERLDGAVEERPDDVVAVAADRLKGPREEAEQHEDERAEAEPVEDEPANVQALVRRRGEGREAQRAADDADEAEHEQVPPAGGLEEAVLEAEENGAGEEDDVEDDLGDGEAIVGVERTMHCSRPCVVLSDGMNECSPSLM